MVIRVEQCAKCEAILSIMYGTPQFDPFHQFKIGPKWRVERRKNPRLSGSLDHCSAPHYSDVIISAMASQITGVLIVYSTVCWGAKQRKHQSPAPLVCVRGIHRSPVNFPAQKPVTQNMFPFDDVSMKTGNIDVGDECSSMKCEVSAPP